jgi:transcription elongation GreA/GreB family factor
MSRAFVKEDSADDADALPERPLPAHANYVTTRGLAQLQVRVRELAGTCETLRRGAVDDTDARQQLRAAERDMRYYSAQLERAELVTPASQHHDSDGSDGSNESRDGIRIRFGASVAFLDEGGVEHTVRIVGDDEADAPAGYISWASPLARALIGARVGDAVTWRRPAGTAEIEILRVEYA